MKIRYEFATGEVSEIEVSEELGRALEEIAHKAKLRDRAESRRHDSFEALMEQGAQFAAQQASVEELAEAALDKAALSRAMQGLEPQQRKLVRMAYFEGRSIASIARSENVHPATISHRLERIQKRLKKMFE